jgi:heterodisulfide reductase subunit B
MCNGCLNTLAIVNHELKHDKGLRDSINEMLKDIGLQFKGTIEVKHFMQVIKEDIGIDTIKSKVVKPLTGLKVAGHPGCHLLMPDDILHFDNPVDPIVFDKFIAALGATAVDYKTKTECCGVSLTLAGAKEPVNDLLKKKLLDVKGAGATVLTTACPFCYTQFDTGQLVASRSVPEIKENPVPVLYAIELLALALGKKIEDIDASAHKIKLNLTI